MPTSTTSSASATSTTDENGGSVLAAGGSTLILAFLAIGLFVGGLLVMFAMRRYMRGRSARRTWRGRPTNPWDQTWDQAYGYGPPGIFLLNIGGVNVTRRPKNFGRKPELSDFRVAAWPASDKCRWEDIMVCLHVQ